VAEEGLMPEIIRAAEQSYGIAREKETKVYMPSRKKDDVPPSKKKPAGKLTDWKPNSRLTRDRGWRYG